MMSTILLKTSMSTSQNRSADFKLISEHHDINDYIDEYRTQFKENCEHSNEPSSMKLEFIYPQRYKETVLLSCE